MVWPFQLARVSDPLIRCVIEWHDIKARKQHTIKGADGGDEVLMALAFSSAAMSASIAGEDARRIV